MESSMVGMAASGRIQLPYNVYKIFHTVCMKVGTMSKAMPAIRRTQAERTAQTRAALIAAARRLFGAEGFADVGAERIAREAGMTRGALYHQFADKAGLFAAVLDQVEAEIAQRVAGAVAGFDPADTIGMLLAGAGA